MIFCLLCLHRPLPRGGRRGVRKGRGGRLPMNVGQSIDYIAPYSDQSKSRIVPSALALCVSLFDSSAQYFFWGYSWIHPQPFSRSNVSPMVHCPADNPTAVGAQNKLDCGADEHGVPVSWARVTSSHLCASHTRLGL